MKQQKNEKRKILLWCLLSAGLAGLIFIAFSVINSIAPFGTATVLRNDAIHQYAPFLANYIQRIKDGSSFLFSWNTGTGVNQYALTAYYLLSPFNLLALPFNNANIDIAFWLIILVKTLFIGLSSCYFFQKKFGESNFLTVFFSLAYTFGGFYICYYYNTMWLDALIMLPLIALGLENIVNGKKATLYFLSLAYAILVNFYLGYMICIFSVLYFFYLLFAKDVTRNAAEKQADELPISTVLLKFGFASLLAGMLAAVVILPVYFAINYGMNKSDFDNVDMLFNFLDFLSYHLTGATPLALEKTTGTAPYVMSSILTLITVPAFFCLKNIKPNKKVASAVVLAIFFFSFAVPKMNYFWHGFAAPANLPYRFTFIYLLFILTLAYETVKNIKELPVWAFGISGLFAVAALVYSQFSQFSDRFPTKALIVSAVCAVVYILLLILYKYDKLNAKLLYPVLAVLIIGEIITGNYQNYVAVKDLDEFYTYSNELDEVKEYIAENEKNDTLCRVDIAENHKKIQTYPALYTYNGISTFSSLSDGDFSGTQKMLGNFGNFGNSYSYVMQSPIYNAMFSMKYIYDAEKVVDTENSPYYEKVADIGNGTLYKVKYTLPIGYCIREDIKAWSPYSYLSTSVQSLLWLYTTGVDGVMDYTKPDNISYTNCYEVSADDVSKYIIDNATEENSKYEEADHDHDHDHEHEHDEYVSPLDHPETASQYEFDLTAENISKITSLIGDVYSLKATDEGFYVSFDFTAKEQGEIMALVYSGSFTTLKVTRENGEERQIDIDDRHISDLGYFEAGEKYTLTVCEPDRPLSEYDAEYPLTDSIQMSVASVNEEKFLEGYNRILENGTLNVTRFDDTHIEGTVKSTVDGFMMMSMPYDLGWTVYVDGEPVELHEHESHIMMFPISKGEHTVQMQYFPQGLKEGILVSVAAVFGLVLVLLLGKVHKMKLELIAEEQKDEETDSDSVSVNTEEKSDK
ncbi:MAG: hypothetical protein E7514_07725 [Ruminococcaceae bacterium]|nr:hypothetical protein [Oscillospiraceae bacterium]